MLDDGYTFLKKSAKVLIFFDITNTKCPNYNAPALIQPFLTADTKYCLSKKTQSIAVLKKKL